MKIALATTTIHVPHTLKLMRKCDPNARFFVAGDTRTPPEVASFEDPHYHYSGFECPIPNSWKCSGTIGWNTLARRNIAFLEALKWGADIIYSWDNDNTPTNTGLFTDVEYALAWNQMFNGIKVSRGNLIERAWFDPGALLIPRTRHRGYPHNSIWQGMRTESVTDAKVGVNAGLIIGNPDVDATTRMEMKPDIAQVHVLGQYGVVVDPGMWTVFNTQNTSVVRELVPAWFLMPGTGRHDDIYASLIVQRVGRERGYHVKFGAPLCYQERNPHDSLVDLRAEIDGMENVSKLAELLDSIVLPGKSVIDDTRTIYQTFEHADFIPDHAIYAAYKWLEDCEGVI
jgi:hypothetical protein